MIRVEQLQGGYSKDPIIKELSFEIKRGQFFALLGPNGSGKTTIFKLVTGVLPIQKGRVIIDGLPFKQLSMLGKARKMAVLSQEGQVSFDFTVEEIVSLGRYAHQTGFFKSLSKKDYQVIEEVMEITKVIQYKHTLFRLLSGGEKQRVLLAKSLAQEPQILLLDEPTNHLDIKHTFEMLSLLKKWQQIKGLTIFAILHDLNVASLFADQVALLHQGKFLDVGDADILRKQKQLEQVYQVRVSTHSHPQIAKPQVLLTPDFSTLEKPIDFRTDYQLEQNDDYIHLQFERPLRTISNAVIGEGIHWVKHFFNFHVDKNYDCSDPQMDMRNWIERLSIASEQSLGMMTAVKLKDMAFVTEQVADDIKIMAMVTAGVGNAVDITGNALPEKIRKIGTINTMVFIEAHLTDGALVNALMSATEAKTKALYDYHIKDPHSNTIATGTSTDSLLIGATQQGEATPYAGSGTLIGKGIGHIVYEATQAALSKYLKGDDGSL